MRIPMHALVGTQRVHTVCSTSHHSGTYTITCIHSGADYWQLGLIHINPLGQSLAAIDKPFDCSLATSQLQASAQQAVMQPSDSHLMQQYFEYKTDVGLEKYLQQIDSFQLRCSLTRFRFGQHWLQCLRGRFHCHMKRNACIQHVDSEQHALFEGPKYESARSSFAYLFREVDSVSDLINRNAPISCKSAKSGSFFTQLRTCR